MGDIDMTDSTDALNVPQFLVPDASVNTAAVPDEFARYADSLSRAFGTNPPASPGSMTTGEVGL